MPICIGFVEICFFQCYVAYMSKQKIKQLIEKKISEDGITETGVPGVQLFRVTQPLSCSPAVYEPTVVAIVSGTKEAIFDGKRFLYDNSQYMCCAISMPVDAGTPDSSPENPLLGVYISLNTNVMTALAVEIERSAGAQQKFGHDATPQAFSLAHWEDRFTDSLLRLLQLMDSPTDTSALGESRLREVYYAVLMGEAGSAALRAFGARSGIACAIEYLSSHLSETITIDELAAHVGMSRAVFHRKFKQTTTMSPMQFVKSMRLNKAAMQIASGISVNEAAMGVGYISTSQFSREFKRMFGDSPKRWSQIKQLPPELT